MSISIRNQHDIRNGFCVAQGNLTGTTNLNDKLGDLINHHMIDYVTMISLALEISLDDYFAAGKYDPYAFQNFSEDNVGKTFSPILA